MFQRPRRPYRAQVQAEALRAYAQQQKYGLEVQNQVAEIKLRAEREAGRLLAEMEKHPGSRNLGQLHDATAEPPTLSDLGIEKTQSHRWRRWRRTKGGGMNPYPPLDAATEAALRASIERFGVLDRLCFLPHAS